MAYSFLVTILQWACIPMVVTALDCYQCETEGTYKSCLKSRTNLQTCDDGDVCYKFAGTRKRKSVVLRGCTNEYENLDCRRIWKYCTLYLSNDSDTPHIRSRNCKAFRSEIGEVSTSLSDQTGIQHTSKHRKRFPMNVTKISMCHCATDGCNSSFKHVQPAIFITFMLVLLSVIFTRMV